MAGPVSGSVSDESASDSARELLFECFWPGVTDADLVALDDRAAATASAFASQGESISYLGSFVMSEDEVVICRFAGTEVAARRVAEAAAIPFARVVVGHRSPRFQSPPGP